MFSYYLQNRAYYFACDQEVEAHIIELSKIMSCADIYDHFLIPISFEDAPYDKWSSIGDFFSTNRKTNTVSVRIWPSIKKRCKTVASSFMYLADMENAMPKTCNAFLGPRFYHKSIELIKTKTEYSCFRETKAQTTLCAASFGACCSICLKNVKVTEEAVYMAMPLGKKIPAIFNQLMLLEGYIKEYWTKGVFNEGDVSSKTALTISDESDTVKQKESLKRHRYFNIPGMGKHYCFLHIKQGNLRMHIFADNARRIVFVPYIGPHLPTKNG